jgi:hypothetical protein
VAAVHLQDCPVFASQLAQLPLLTELFVTKGYTEGRGEISHAPQEGSATFERFLHSLKKLQGLRVLRVAAINDDVSLSRSTSALYRVCARKRDMRHTLALPTLPASHTLPCAGMH